MGDWLRRWCIRRVRAALQTLAFAGVSVLGLALLAVLLAGVVLVPLGVGVYLVPVAVASIRWLANVGRRLTSHWWGGTIPVPYSPPPRDFGTGIDGWWRRWRWMFADPATWRDLLWVALNPVVLAATGGIALVAAVESFWVLGSELPFVLEWLSRGDPLPPRDEVIFLLSYGMGLLGVGLAGLLLLPALMRAYAVFAPSLLAPTREAELAVRVQHLAETRTDAVDIQAAELRRIERDLHDGAQARLVAMGMSIGAAERLLEDNPQAARALLIEAREASVKALDELRDLVRGIHPPVLADRGLGDAVRALALDHPLAVEVAVDLAGRLEPPVESAAYFAVSEVLANAAKHSGARRVWIDLANDDGKLRISVTDDGRGGAAMTESGTGLRGIERRLATFDGVLALNSPPGGPTMVMMELPCALSSPKTSSS